MIKFTDCTYKITAEILSEKDISLEAGGLDTE